MSLEGALRVGLRMGNACIEDVRIESSRPDVAQALLQGRTRAEVQAAVPLLFSVCARSQAAACELACDAAEGPPPDEDQRQAARDRVAAEMLREGTWQVLLNWPRWLDEAPDDRAIAATRIAAEWRVGAGQLDAGASRAVAGALFGCEAESWLRIDTWAELRAWASSGGCAAARCIAELDRASPHPVPAPWRPLPTPATGWLRDLAAQAFAEPGFVRRPVFQGAPAETGALARHAATDTLLARTHGAPAQPVLRQVARLRELAMLLSGAWQPSVGAQRLGPGCALSWVDNARGLLVHAVQVEDGRVQRLHIVAPTEWNFHPLGALPLGLRGAPAADAGAAQQLATRLINSLDPCVACHVEMDDDA